MSALDLCDAMGDEILGYEVRLRLSAWAAAEGDSATRLRSFDWCLERHLGDRSRFPATVGDLDLLWDFASIPRLLTASPRFDLETVDECLDDLLRACSAETADLGGYLLACFEVAFATGRDKRALTTLDRLREHPVESPTLCAACRQSLEAQWHAEHERYDRAARVFDQLHESGALCADEPELALARSLLPTVRAGRIADACATHVEGYRLAHRHPKNLEAIAAHISFAVTVGDLQSALAMVERHASWLTADPLAVAAQFSFLCAAGGAMDALTRAAKGSVVVKIADDPRLAPYFGSRVGHWTPVALAQRCWITAEAMATAFDDRNGTERFAGLLRRARAIKTIVSRPVDLRSGGRRKSTVSGVARQPDSMQTPDELLLFARERAAVGDTEPAFRAIETALPRADGTTRAELFAVGIRMHVEAGDLEAAARMLAQRVDCLLLDDLDDEAEVDLQLGLLLFGAPLGARSADLRAALQRIRTLGLSAAARLRVVVALASLSLQEAQYAEAEELLLAELTLPPKETGRRDVAFRLLADARFALGQSEGTIEALDILLGGRIDRALRASALLRRSSLVFILDGGAAAEALDRALDDADRALALFVELDHCEGILDACGVVGELLARVGSVDGSLEALRTARATAARFHHQDATTLAFRLARALVRADRGDEARDILETVYDSVVASEADPGVRGELLYWIGYACRQADDDPAAYCAWSVAIEEFVRAEDAWSRARVGIALGRLLLDNDENSSIAVLQQAVRAARAASSGLAGRSAPGAHATTLIIDALHLLGRAQAAFGDPEGLRTLEDVLREAMASERCSPMLEASVLESKARAFDDLEREDEAAALAVRAAELHDAAGDIEAAAHVWIFGARLLALSGKIDEARALYATCIHRFESINTPTAIAMTAFARREREGLY